MIVIGTAGYGNDTWAIGHSYADKPVLTPAIYNPAAPAGSRWSRNGYSASTVPRMYHSTATLLPDGEGVTFMIFLEYDIEVGFRIRLRVWIEPKPRLHCGTKCCIPHRIPDRNTLPSLLQSKAAATQGITGSVYLRWTIFQRPVEL